MDVSKNSRNNSRDGRPRDDLRRPRRSGSRSRDRHQHRSRSPRRLYRPSISLSPSPPKREVVNEDKMEPRHPPPYYQSSGFRDDYGTKGSMPLNPAFMNPNMNSNVRIPVPPASGPNPVQYPINPGNTYGRFPGYNPPPNMFNNGPPQPHGFQPQMPRNFPQNQYPQPHNFPGFNPSVQMGIHENPPNPVPFPSSWNQVGHGCNQNYSMSNIPTAVTYPHLKIGQPRVDSFGNQEKSDDFPQHKRSKSSSEKLKYSRSKSPDPKKHRRKSSKRHSKSPMSNRKYEERDRRNDRNSRSPIIHSRFETKRPRVIIDPNRIPTPPPPPIVGSYDKDDARKLNDQRAKILDMKTNKDDPLSDFLNKDKVSLSCLLEAVMENSGQGKSQLSNPKVKKEIISKCETKIRHLYKRRMTGLGAFIPDPIQSSCVIAHVSPLVAVCSRITYNCEEESNDWHCPGIIIPDVKTKVEQDFSSMEHDLDNGGRLGIENPTVIPTLTNNQNLSKQNWGNNMTQHQPNQNTYTHIHENNRQNMFPSYQPHQNWMNPVSPQNQYPIRPLMPSHVSDIPTLGAVSRPPGYSFNMHPGPEFMPPHPGYPPQPGMLTYPPRVNYPPIQPLPPQNLNHPRVYRMLQPNPSTKNYQFNADDAPKSKKNKNNVNNNLIILNNPSSRPGSVQKTTQKDEKVNRNLTDENNSTRNKMENSDDNNKMPRGTNEAKDKLLRKLWQLRKSSDYVHVPVDQQCTKEQDNEFYQKLNYAEMQEDTQLDTIHDYQLVNLRERIETCLAEGKVPSDLQHRSSDRRIGDKDRERERQRGRDRTKERERSRRDPNDSDRKRHGRSPTVDERKKYRPGESHDRRRSRESSSQKEQGNKLNKEEVIEIISDDEHKLKVFDENLSSEGLGRQNEKAEPSEKTLTTLIFDLLGPEIRKTQEKSDLYKSIIDSLEHGDRAYKRLYTFRNSALIKSDKDNKMKMVVPRDNLKDVVTAIHKNFHNIQSEELSKLLKDLIYPNMLHIPKCISKVVSECPACIELKKKEEKKEETSKDKKTDKGEKKPEKRIDRSVRDRDKDKKSSHDKDKRISKDRSLSSSKGRRDLSRSLRERDIKDSSVNDGRPSGYEKATKVRKLGPAAPAETSKVTVCAEPSGEICKDQPENKSSQVLHGLNDKALEFKNTTDLNIEEPREKSVDRVNADQNTTTGTDGKGNENEMVSSSDLCVNNLDDQNQDLKTESPAAKVEVNNGVVVPISEMTKDIIIPSDNLSKSASEENMKSNEKEVKENDVIEGQDKALSDTKANVAESKDAPILDFKGRVRQVQMSSSDFRDIITSLESLGDGNLVDQSYLMKGGMLCRKNTAKSASEVKIVAPPDHLEDLVNIVHTMSPVHTPAAKVVIFFSKHFTAVDNLDLKVNEFVNTCSNCKVKGS